MPDKNHDDRQLELPFDEEESPEDEPMSFSREEAGGLTICGTCGEPIRGEVYFNRYGPAHWRCFQREIL